VESPGAYPTKHGNMKLMTQILQLPMTPFLRRPVEEKPRRGFGPEALGCRPLPVRPRLLGRRGWPGDPFFALSLL
jgi:hypothetical protein